MKWKLLLFILVLGVSCTSKKDLGVLATSSDFIFSSCSSDRECIFETGVCGQLKSVSSNDAKQFKEYVESLDRVTFCSNFVSGKIPKFPVAKCVLKKCKLAKSQGWPEKGYTAEVKKLYDAVYSDYSSGDFKSCRSNLEKLQKKSEDIFASKIISRKCGHHNSY